MTCLVYEAARRAVRPAFLRLVRWCATIGSLGRFNGLLLIGGNLEWKMIGIGALVSVGLILLDITLGALNKLRIPPLAVGIGIYLPMSATFAVVIAAVISHWYSPPNS